jgi:predicted HTH domain antitoxin
VSRAKVAELLGIPLAEFPALLAEYGIPSFNYSTEELERDLESLSSTGARER